MKINEVRSDSTDVDERAGHYNRFQYDASEDDEDDEAHGGVSLHEYHASQQSLRQPDVYVESWNESPRSVTSGMSHSARNIFGSVGGIRTEDQFGTAIESNTVDLPRDMQPYGTSSAAESDTSFKGWTFTLSSGVQPNGISKAAESDTSFKEFDIALEKISKASEERMLNLRVAAVAVAKRTIRVNCRYEQDVAVNAERVRKHILNGCHGAWARWGDRGRVYALRHAELGLVKIGYTSRDIESVKMDIERQCGILRLDIAYLSAELSGCRILALIVQQDLAPHQRTFECLCRGTRARPVVRHEFYKVDDHVFRRTVEVWSKIIQQDIWLKDLASLSPGEKATLNPVWRSRLTAWNLTSLRWGQTHDDHEARLAEWSRLLIAEHFTAVLPMKTDSGTRQSAGTLSAGSLACGRRTPVSSDALAFAPLSTTLAEGILEKSRSGQGSSHSDPTTPSSSPNIDRTGRGSSCNTYTGISLSESSRGVIGNVHYTYHIVINTPRVEVDTSRCEVIRMAQSD